MDPNLVAVVATEERYRALRHQPSGAGFDENGRGEWPADQFTYALRDEGSIRLLGADELAPSTPAPIVEAAPRDPETSGLPASRRR